MRKIAIIKPREIYAAYDDVEKIIERITEFTEVDAETYELLRRAQHEFEFVLIEQPVDQQKFVLDTIEDYKKLIVMAEQKKKEAEKLAAQKKLERRMKVDMKKQEERLKIFQELQKEFDPETAPKEKE